MSAGAGGAEPLAVAADHYRQGRWREACAAFAQALADDLPADRAVDARFYYGEALAQLGDWNEARQQFETLLRAVPAGAHSRQALFRAGEAAYMIGDDQAARARLQKFHEQYPDDPLGAYALPYLGSIELQNGQAAAAVGLFSEAVERFRSGPLAVEAQFGRAQALEQADQLEAARQGYQAVADSAHTLAEKALLQSAAIENALGRHGEALAAFDQLAARFPASELAERARLGRGYALHKLDRHAEAVELLKTIAADPTVGLEASYWRALADKAQQHWSAAADTLAALRVPDDHPLAAAINFHAGDSQLHAGRAAEARAAFDRLLANFPDSAWADDALAGKLRLAVDDQDHEQSLRLADELVQRFADSPLVRQAQLAKGQALVALDKPAEAAQVLRSLVASVPATEGPLAETAARARAALAVAQARLGDFDEAQQVLESLAETDFEAVAAETRYQLGELAAAGGQTQRAAELFDAVGGARGAQHLGNQAQSGLAWTHFQAQRWADAAAAFGRVLEDDPQGPLAAEAALLRGRALEHQNDFDGALAMYRAVIESYPESTRAAEALWHDAILQEQLGRPDAARDSYSALIEKHPDFAERDAALFRYASVLASTEPAAADALLRRLKHESPGSRFAPDATLRLAERALEEDELDKAAGWLAEISGPEAPAAVRRQALYLSGRLAMARGDWSAAAAPLEQLVADFPTSDMAPRAGYLLAEAAFRQGDYQRAAERLAAVAEASPEGDEPWLAAAELRRAQALAHLRQWDESLAAARGIAARFPDFAQQFEADYVIGRALAAQADFAAARQAYARVLAAPAAAGTETAAMAQWMLGESYFHQQDHGRALAEYVKVDDRYPRWHAAALLQAGKCAEAAGQWAAAAEHYDRLLARYPSGELSDEATRRQSAARARAGGGASLQ